MKAGSTARATDLPLQFDINHLFGDKYELTHTDDVREVAVTTIEQDEEKEHTEYEYDLYLETATVSNYDDMVSALVALKYTPGDEIALMRKGIADAENEEYVVYLDYVAACKSVAKQYYGAE